MDPEFEWDDDKAAANRLNHGVTFEEARTALDDPYRIMSFDQGHSESEDRWRVIGRTSFGRLVAVVCTERGAKGLLRNN